MVNSHEDPRSATAAADRAAPAPGEFTAPLSGPLTGVVPLAGGPSPGEFQTLLEELKSQERPTQAEQHSATADLAEWERCLEEREQDLKLREAAVAARRAGSIGDSRGESGPGKEHDFGAWETVHDSLDSRGREQDYAHRMGIMNDLLNELGDAPSSSNTGNQEFHDSPTELDLQMAGEGPAATQSASGSQTSPEVRAARDALDALRDGLESERRRLAEECERMKSDRKTFEADREQMRQLLEALRRERDAQSREEKTPEQAHREEAAPELELPPGIEETTILDPTETVEMFGSTPVPAQSSAEPSADDNEPDSDRIMRLFPQRDENSPPAADAPPPRSTPRPGEYELTDVDQDSISQYMSRLLARSRTKLGTGSTSGEFLPVQIEQPSHAPAATKTETSVAASEIAEAPPAEPLAPVAAVHPPKPRLRQDPDKIRAGLESLRAVANQSARGAIKNHFWKRQRSTMTLKLVLSLVAWSLASFLYWRYGVAHGAFSTLAWGASAIGLIAFASVINTWGLAARLHGRSARALGTQPVISAGGTEILDDPMHGD